MPTEQRPPSGTIGNLLIALGILVFGVGIWWMTDGIDAPLEEPATQGRPPNPSMDPWTFDRAELDRQSFWWEVQLWAELLALPVLGAALMLAGSILTVRASRRSE